jgi:o-succinylbenzoate synthase
MDYKTNFRFDQEIEFSIIPFTLRFKKPAKTSRDTLTEREIFFIKIFYKNNPEVYGLGECSPIYGLSPEAPSIIQTTLEAELANLKSSKSIDFGSISVSSVRFCLEMAILDLINGGQRRLSKGSFNQPIPINGLVWMNSVEVMRKDGLDKIFEGFATVKFKIGAEDFNDELEMLRTVRENFNSDRIIIRLDANGAFNANNALEKLLKLNKFNIHSIEQPIAAGNWKLMSELVDSSPIPIALDEELIGILSYQKKRELLETIHPSYIVLKPMLHGGIGGCLEWISAAKETGVKFWITSMLESSVGLNIIAQWVAEMNVELPQGLGTGGLYDNNLPAAWETKGGYLHFKGQEALDQIQL